MVNIQASAGPWLGGAIPVWHVGHPGNARAVRSKRHGLRSLLAHGRPSRGILWCGVFGRDHGYLLESWSPPSVIW